MSKNTPDAPRKPRQKRTSRADIILPTGEVLRPRERFCAEELDGVHPRTARRMNLPSVNIGGVVFIARDAALKVIAADVERRNQPVEHRPPRKAAARGVR